MRKGKRRKPENCRFAWADEIFRELEDALKQSRIPTWHKQDDALFPFHICNSSDHKGLAGKRKIQLMLALIQNMRSWLAANLHLLKSNKQIFKCTDTVSTVIGVLIIIILHYVLQDNS